MTKTQGGVSTRISETYSGVKALQIAIAGDMSRRIVAARENNWSTLIQASPDNGGVLYVGDGLLQPIQLAAGESITIATDAYEIYIRGNGQTANVLMLV